MKRIISFMLSMLVIALALAGCSSEGNYGFTPGTPTSTAVPPVVTHTMEAVPPTNTAEVLLPAEGTPTGGVPLTPPATPTAAALMTATIGTGGKPDTVRFALDWTPNTNHTGIYVAAQQGWYQQQGIDLQILPYSDANSPDTLVATGQADFGVSFEESVTTDRVNKLPVKSVAAVLQTNTSALATLKASGLDRPARLEGKRYAGFGAPFEAPVITTMLKQDGAPSGAFQNITTNLFGYQALVAGQADFLWLYLGWDGVQAKLDNVALNTFLLTDYGIPDYYTPVIIANESFLQTHAAVARRFLAATTQGYESAVRNPAAAADLLIAGAPPGTFPNPELPRRSAAYLAPFYKANQAHWGVQTLDYWTNFPHFIAATGLLKTSDGTVVQPADIDYAGLFTNDFLPQP